MITLTKDRAEELAELFVAPFKEIAQTRVSFEAVDQWKAGIVFRLMKEFGQPGQEEPEDDD